MLKYLKYGLEQKNSTRSLIPDAAYLGERDGPNSNYLERSRDLSSELFCLDSFVSVLRCVSTLESL